MAALYSGCVTHANPLPNLWLISDARNDPALEAALAKLPRGSGFVFRHYHLDGDARHTRFDELAAAARARGHLVIVSGSAALARAWSADGIYGASQSLGPPGNLLRLATVHDAREMALANDTKADAVFLSPVFPTQSHPGAACLGAATFHELAAQAAMPVIALGGMTVERAHMLDWRRWAAIDGLI